MSAIAIAPEEESCEGEAFLPPPFAPQLNRVHPLAFSCVCPLPGPCTCGAVLE